MEVLLHHPCISRKLSRRAALSGGCAITLQNLPLCHGSAIWPGLHFFERIWEIQPTSQPSPCNHTQPQPTSEHQFHTQNMTQATRPQAAQGSQAERLVPSCKNHSSPKAQQNQHKEKIFDTGDFCSFVTGAAPLTSSSYALSPVTQPGLAQSLQAFYQLAPPELGVREEMQQWPVKDSQLMCFTNNHEQDPGYLPAPQSQTYQLPRLVTKPSQQTSHVLPEPDFTKEKNPTLSPTPDLAISYSTQQEGREINQHLHSLQRSDWRTLITKQKYFNKLPLWVKPSHPLDLWPSKSHQRCFLVFMDFTGDSSMQLTLNVYSRINSKGLQVDCNYWFWPMKYQSL